MCPRRFDHWSWHWTSRPFPRLLFTLYYVSVIGQDWKECRLHVYHSVWLPGHEHFTSITSYDWRVDMYISYVCHGLRFTGHVHFMSYKIDSYNMYTCRKYSILEIEGIRVGYFHDNYFSSCHKWWMRGRLEGYTYICHVHPSKTWKHWKEMYISR